jgi:1-pyrroline-5-carboxylate dehydrogenase
MHFLHDSADVENAAMQSTPSHALLTLAIRSAFEYNGQKCSACSRVYVPDTLYEEFSAVLLREHAKLRVGDVTDFKNHVTAVINREAYTRITGYIDAVKTGENANTTILAGGGHSDEKGYFIDPTILVTKDPKSPTMVEELFGPVVTVFVYPAEEFEETLKLADSSSAYALTCGM